MKIHSFRARNSSHSPRKPHSVTKAYCPVWIDAVGMLIIGDNLFGYPTYICLREPRVGHVFYYDIQQRSHWEDEQFSRMFESLDEDIKEYLRLRSDGKLPQKENGFESFYHVASSFTEFQNLLRDEEIEE